MNEQTQTVSRRHSRAHADVYVNKIVGDEPHLARVRDISAGGVYLYKLLEPEVDAGHVGLEIMLPGTDRIIWAVAKVLREDQANTAQGTALRFVRIAESDRQLIRDYVDGGEIARAA